MLTALRRLAGTFVARLFFLLLILSFAVWGVGDVVRNWGGNAAVARVGDQSIELAEAQSALRRELTRLSRSLGQNFEPTPEIRAAVARQVMESLILDRALRVEANRLGLGAPDTAVRDFVFAAESFQGPGGIFSRPLFERFLRNNETTEAYFLDVVRTDVVRRQVSEAVRAGAALPPDALTRPLTAWRLETRSATVVTLPLADAPPPPEPEVATLRRWQENNPEQFSSPEYREVSVAVLTADRIAREISVSDAELAQAYEARRANFQAAERRAIEQLLVNDEAAAAALATAWRDGASFSAIGERAEAAGGSAIELGTVTRAELPVPELAEAAFTLATGAVSAPVRSPFGWHVLRAVRIEPAAERTLDDVRETLRAEIAGERAADRAFERANRVEDALAGGASLEEVATRFDLGFARLRTDREGRDAAGREVELPVIAAARAPLLTAIFAADPGAAPRLRESEAGFAAISIHEVVRPTLKPFQTVEAAVRAGYAAQARRRTQEERAAALLAAVRGGQTLVEAARAAGLGSREVGGLARDAPAGGPAERDAVPPALRAPLFELKVNEPTMVETGDGFAVGQLLSVTPAEPTAAQLADTRRELADALGRDLETQYLIALRARASVRINARMMESLAQP